MTTRSRALKDYEEKRDFRRTTEPRGRRARRTKPTLAFVVQKHDARRLHYDFRVEWNGVLLSWAVTKGPSLDPADKRLAVRTEDHPLDYASFEGVIPKGEYGGGTVMIWDEGTWEPEGDPEEGLRKGHLKFDLAGERMRGRWDLVRMKPRKGEKRENWLLIKADDRHASTRGSLVSGYGTSVKTGRAMDAIASGKGSAKAGGGNRKSRRLANPGFQKVQLATLVDEAPEGDGWLHETKFDGYRALASIGKDGVTLYTRSGLDWNDRYAGLPEALSELDCRSALVDGEVISGSAPRKGSGFSTLQSDLEQGRPVRFMAFDLLSLDGRDLRDTPIEERKEKLQTLMASASKNGPVRYSEHVTGHGRKVFEEIAGAGGEGIVSKRLGSVYRGRRTRDWLKIKATRRQEFVIGGFSPSSARGRPFASLLLGTWNDGRLVYRGRVGTGFDEETLEHVAARLGKRARKTPPFDEVPASVAKDAEWVRPDLVAEIDYTELTSGGIVRHAVFMGLRDDKKADEVTLERKRDAGGGGALKVAGVTITHPDRVVFEDAKVTKGDIARYYDAASARMLDLAGDRPVSLLRCPSGAGGDCFFQKHAGKGFPGEIGTIDLEEASGETAAYMVLRKEAGFPAAAQMGAIEFHIWGARCDDLEQPDRLVLDLDPDESIGFSEVRRAALAVRDLLGRVGLDSVPMVTGGKGVHVIVPLRRTAGWETVGGFARTVAAHFARSEPDRYTATMSKARRKGRVFIDWLRNERGATAVAPYSVRNRKGAPVAVPLTWKELDRQKSANSFSIDEARDRLRSDCPLQALKATQPISGRVISELEDIVAAS